MPFGTRHSDCLIHYLSLALNISSKPPSKRLWYILLDLALLIPPIAIATQFAIRPSHKFPCLAHIVKELSFISLSPPSLRTLMVNPSPSLIFNALWTSPEVPLPSMALLLCSTPRGGKPSHEDSKYVATGKSTSVAHSRFSGFYTAAQVCQKANRTRELKIRSHYSHDQ